MSDKKDPDIKEDTAQEDEQDPSEPIRKEEYPPSKTSSHQNDDYGQCPGKELAEKSEAHLDHRDKEAFIN